MWPDDADGTRLKNPHDGLVEGGVSPMLVEVEELHPGLIPGTCEEKLKLPLFASFTLRRECMAH